MLMDVEEILARLVAFPSVVGTPNDAIMGWMRDHCRAAGASVTVLPGPEGDRANLFAAIGPREIPGYIISGHMDVVPAGEPDWHANPYQLGREGDRLYGRGTTDMKGFLACALAALRRLAALPLRRPIHLELSAVLVALTGHEPVAAVSYGTEAGLYQQAGIDAIVCGPGDIGRAHRPNEYIETGELAECQTVIEAFAARLAA